MQEEEEEDEGVCVLRNGEVFQLCQRYFTLSACTCFNLIFPIGNADMSLRLFITCMISTVLIADEDVFRKVVHTSYRHARS